MIRNTSNSGRPTSWQSGIPAYQQAGIPAHQNRSLQAIAIGCISLLRDNRDSGKALKVINIECQYVCEAVNEHCGHKRVVNLLSYHSILTLGQRTISLYDGFGVSGATQRLAAGPSARASA